MSRQGRPSPYGKTAPAQPPPAKGAAAAASNDAAAGAAAAVAAGAVPAVAPAAYAGGVLAVAAAGVPVRPSLAEILATLRADGEAKGGKAAGRGGGRGQQGHDAEMKLHRQALLQLDARVRRREAHSLTFLAPEAFPPAHAGATALTQYIRAAKADPAHAMGPLDVVIFMAVLEELTVMSVVELDIGIQMRMAVLYLLHNLVTSLDPDMNSEWIHSCCVAAIPAAGTKPARCLLDIDIEGEVLLPTAAQMPEIVAEVQRAVSTDVDFSGIQRTLFTMHDGIPTVPWAADRRGHRISKILSAVFCSMGATMQHGPAARGKVFKLLAKGKGKGKEGKGKHDGMDEDFED